MNHRFTEIYGLSAALAANQTIPIELNMVDPVSQLLIELRTLNGAGGDTTQHPLAAITKVEIVDGSDVLFSLDGFEMQALDIYDNGLHPRGGWFNYLVNTPTDVQVAINFGRYLWDEMLAFDPKKFLNPKLNITIDYDGGGMNPASVQIAVKAAMFDEKEITPSGFLMTKEHKRWTQTAASHEYTDCPQDYPYRKMFLQSRYDSNPPYWVFDNIKLASDQDKKVIVDGSFRDLMFSIGRQNAYIQELLTAGTGAAQQVFHVTPTVDVMAMCTEWDEDGHGLQVATYDCDGGHLESIAEVACNVSFNIAGWAPHGTLCLPFGKQDIIEDWFKPLTTSSLRLDCLSGVTLATQKLFIQQYRTYA